MLTRRRFIPALCHALLPRRDHLVYLLHLSATPVMPSVADTPSIPPQCLCVACCFPPPVLEPPPPSPLSQRLSPVWAVLRFLSRWRPSGRCVRPDCVEARVVRARHCSLQPPS